MQFSLFLAIFAAFVAGYMFNRFQAGRPGKGGHFAMTYDGRVFQGALAKPVPEGIQVADVTYSAGMYQSVQPLPNVTLYLIAAEPVPLADHRALEKARRTIVLRALFSPGGDLLRYLQMAAVIVPLVFYFFVYSTVGQLQGSLNRVDGSLALVKDVVSKPLVVECKK